MRMVKGLIAVLGSLVAAMFIVVAPANAAGTHECQATDVCLYYNTAAYGYGAVYEQQVDVANYAGKYFSCGKNGCAGAGTAVKNNAAVVDSFSGYDFMVYYNSGYDCSIGCQRIPSLASFDPLKPQIKNNDASGKFLN